MRWPYLLNNPNCSTPAERHHAPSTPQSCFPHVPHPCQNHNHVPAIVTDRLQLLPCWQSSLRSLTLLRQDDRFCRTQRKVETVFINKPVDLILKISLLTGEAFINTDASLVESFFVRIHNLAETESNLVSNAMSVGCGLKISAL